MGLFEVLIGLILVTVATYYILVQLRLYVDDRIEAERSEFNECLLQLKHYMDKKIDPVNDRFKQIETRLDQHDKEQIKNERGTIEVEKSVLQNFL